jgi:cardiolipin synthase
VFEQDIGRSKRVTLADWQNRPWHEKLMERAAGLLNAQL